MLVSVTGHRPKDLGGYHVMPKLYLFAKDIFKRSTRPSMVLTGMALGWDQAVAEACIALDIPFTACVPFPGQESRWPKTSQRLYRGILSKASGVVFIAQEFSNQAMQQRNKYMVDNADLVVALHNPQKQWGGTYNCVQYAEQTNKRIVNLWERWTRC